MEIFKVDGKYLNLEAVAACVAKRSQNGQLSSVHVNMMGGMKYVLIGSDAVTFLVWMEKNKNLNA